jgi:hypothetical protein
MPKALSLFVICAMLQSLGGPRCDAKNSLGYGWIR